MTLRIRMPVSALLTAIYNLRCGTLTPTKIYYGNTVVTKIYLGSNLIYG